MCVLVFKKNIPPHNLISLCERNDQRIRSLLLLFSRLFSIVSRLSPPQMKAADMDDGRRSAAYFKPLTPTFGTLTRLSNEYTASDFGGGNEEGGGTWKLTFSLDVRAW